ncbi:nudix hydrolase [Yersinia phage MHG19]|nr:nudix hydrolase [Yersinia phage MHG19]
MELSAVIIFVNKERTHVFMGHATETPRWDIPKGHVEEGETPLQGALRECKEESGFIVQDSENLIDLGRQKYSSNKDIHVFLYLGSQLPVPALCHCDSWFMKGTRKVYEMDRFEWVPIEDIPNRCGKSMTYTLQTNLSKFIGGL